MSSQNFSCRIFLNHLSKNLSSATPVSWLRQKQPSHQKGLSPTHFHLFLTELVSCKSVMLPQQLLCNADPKHHEHTNQNICEYNKPGREVIMLRTDQKMSFIVQLRILQFQRN